MPKIQPASDYGSMDSDQLTPGTNPSPVDGNTNNDITKIKPRNPLKPNQSLFPKPKKIKSLKEMKAIGYKMKLKKLGIQEPSNMNAPKDPAVESANKTGFSYGDTYGQDDQD